VKIKQGKAIHGTEFEELVAALVLNARSKCLSFWRSTAPTGTVPLCAATIRLLTLTLTVDSAPFNPEKVA
jgi:hypothetical protein